MRLMFCLKIDTTLSGGCPGNTTLSGVGVQGTLPFLVGVSREHHPLWWGVQGTLPSLVGCPGNTTLSGGV